MKLDSRDSFLLMKLEQLGVILNRYACSDLEHLLDIVQPG